jgi:predicted RNA-binding Zn-ribbon protein involved in translation (DUF1610 family)
MERKTALIAALVLVCVGALAYSLRKTHVFGSAEPPIEVLQQKCTMIQNKPPYGTETLSLSDWRSRGQKDGKYKGKSGKYEMVTVLECGSCGEQIPICDPPENIFGYMCPKCGKRVMRGAPGS